MTSRRPAANRLNAKKSTGPRTAAGKYRSALNLQTRRLMSEELERELRARGEDPREFCRLHRDLAAIFRPNDRATSVAVTMLACAWWQKARRIRQWVGAGRPPCPELDARIEALLILVVSQIRSHHGPWKRRLAAVVGDWIGDPSEVRRDIEAHLSLFGGRGKARRAQPGSDAEQEALRTIFDKFAQEIIAENASRSEGAKATQTHSSESHQNQQDRSKSAVTKPIEAIRILFNGLWARKGRFLKKG